MREHRVSLPEIALIAATRGILGLGAGLLMADRIGRARRETLGWAMVVVGAVSTIPLAVRLLRGRDEARRAGNGQRDEPGLGVDRPF